MPQNVAAKKVLDAVRNEPGQRVKVAVSDIDGVLIGFVHSPAPIIENIGGAGVNRYGSIVMNPNLGLAPETPVVLTVKALGSTPKPH